MADAASSLFQASNPLDGDSLITGLVDAFNSLAESVASAFLPASGASTTSGNGSEVPPSLSMEPAAVLPSAADTSVTTAPTVIDVPSSEPIATAPETVDKRHSGRARVCNRGSNFRRGEHARGGHRTEHHPGEHCSGAITCPNGVAPCAAPGDAVAPEPG